MQQEVVHGWRCRGRRRRKRRRRGRRKQRAVGPRRRRCRAGWQGRRHRHLHRRGCGCGRGCGCRRRRRPLDRRPLRRPRASRLRRSWRRRGGRGRRGGQIAGAALHGRASGPAAVIAAGRQVRGGALLGLPFGAAPPRQVGLRLQGALEAPCRRRGPGPRLLLTGAAAGDLTGRPAVGGGTTLALLCTAAAPRPFALHTTHQGARRGIAIDRRSRASIARRCATPRPSPRPSARWGADTFTVCSAARTLPGDQLTRTFALGSPRDLVTPNRADTAPESMLPKLPAADAGFDALLRVRSLATSLSAPRGRSLDTSAASLLLLLLLRDDAPTRACREQRAPRTHTHTIVTGQGEGWRCG